VKIAAAVLRSVGGPVTIEEVDLDPPKAGEALVRVAASGICGSDLHVIDGSLPEPLPLVLGHEAAGIVEEVGPGVSSLARGDAVVLSIVPFCGLCSACRRGRVHLCELAGTMASTGTLRDGTSRLHAGGETLHHFNSVSSWATHAVVPESGAVRLEVPLDLERAALLSCAVLTGVGAVLNTAAVPAGATVAVIGCGGVGLSVIEGARIAGASRIVAFDQRASILDAALSAGATDAVDANEGSMVDSLHARQPAGADFVFECVGRSALIEQAWQMTSIGGTTVVVGLPPKGTASTIDNWGFICDKKLLGCFLGSGRPAIDVPRYAELAVRGELRLGGIATDRVSLEELPEALRRAGQGESVRYLLVNA
jgi:S-(hydroxymethyl)glutathione dehydrogenase/alcohol dehydrogenase